MSNLFEDLERQEKMIFIEENSKEDKENIIQKEQQGYDDFIKNLDKRIYKDLGKFPLKYPNKITYPKDMDMGDDFILLSTEEDFYLFPKVLKNKLLDYLKFEKYVKENPIKFNFSEKGLNNILNTCLFSIPIQFIFAIPFCFVGSGIDNDLLFCTGMILFITILLSVVVGAIADNAISVRKNMNKYEVFLSKLEKLKFPLEFFRKNGIDKIYIKKSELDEYKEHFSL